MKVVERNGVHKAMNVHELEAILMKRLGDGYNSFWLSHDDEEYPTLSVLVKGNLTTLYFMPKEFDAGLNSVGNMVELTPGETTTFSISNSLADDVVVLNDAVVPFSVALQAAKEFFSSKELPRSVKWLPL
jgi:hypothetical protein